MCHQVMDELLSCPSGPSHSQVRHPLLFHYFLMGPLYKFGCHFGRCTFVVYIYLKVWWMGLRTGLWGWAA